MLLSAQLSRVPPNSLIGRAVRLPLYFIPKETVVTVRGGLNRGLKWIVGSNIHGCWLGHYEEEKQRLVQRLVKPGMTVFDIGANAGFYTLIFSRLVGGVGRVWAFEPLAENAKNLLEHIRLNAITNATVLQAAVSDRSGLSGFDIAANNSMGKIAGIANNYMVPTVALDELIANGSVQFPNLIKLDVEGAESLVITGASASLLEHKTVLLVALHGAKQKHECISKLSDMGYQLFELNGNAIAGRETAPFDEIVALPPGQTWPIDSLS